MPRWPFHRLTGTTRVGLGGIEPPTSALAPRITTTVELESAGQVLKMLGRGGLRGKAIIRVS